MITETSLYNIEFKRGEVVFTRKSDNASTVIKGNGLLAQWRKYERRGENMERLARAMLETQGRPAIWK